MTAKLIRMSLLIAAGTALAIGGLMLTAWSIDETHFDRPSAAFDAFETELAALPGVEVEGSERWVEAPTFSDPTSWVHVTVDEAGLPGLLDAACTSAYPEDVTWHIRVRTPSDGEVALNASPSDPTAGERACPGFGLDAVRLVAELDRVAPGSAIQPSIWEEGVLALVALADFDDPEAGTGAGFAHLLPLVAHADALRAAAGLDPDAVVELNASDLDFRLEPGEGDAYLALLTALADRGATSFWADGGGTPIDGIERVQVAAPTAQHAAIEQDIRSSGLHIADLEVRFIEQ